MNSAPWLGFIRRSAGADSEATPGLAGTAFWGPIIIPPASGGWPATAPVGLLAKLSATTQRTAGAKQRGPPGRLHLVPADRSGRLDLNRAPGRGQRNNLRLHKKGAKLLRKTMKGSACNATSFPGAKGAARANGIVVAAPSFDQHPGSQGIKDVALEQLVTRRAIESPFVTILPRRSRCDVECLDADSGVPLLDGSSNKVRATVEPEVSWRTARRTTLPPGQNVLMLELAGNAQRQAFPSGSSMMVRNLSAMDRAVFFAVHGGPRVDDRRVTSGIIFCDPQRPAPARRPA